MKYFLMILLLLIPINAGADDRICTPSTLPADNCRMRCSYLWKQSTALNSWGEAVSFINANQIPPGQLDSIRKESSNGKYYVTYWVMVCLDLVECWDDQGICVR